MPKKLTKEELLKRIEELYQNEGVLCVECKKNLRNGISKYCLDCKKEIEYKMYKKRILKVKK